MDFSTTPVYEFCSDPVVCVPHNEPLDKVHACLQTHQISAAAVTNNGKLVGVVSRTDLLRVGRRIAEASGYRQPHSKQVTLDLPGHEVSMIMTRQVATVANECTLKDACAEMVKKKVHRVFVVEDDKLLGVLSTLDAQWALIEGKSETPISSIMSQPVITTETTALVADAVTNLESAHISGVVVTEDQWPVGVFTQVEAMASKDVPAETAVGQVMDPALIYLPAQTTLARAAQMSVRMRVRRIAVSDKREMVGLISGLDFARAVAESL